MSCASIAAKVAYRRKGLGINTGLTETRSVSGEGVQPGGARIQRKKGKIGGKSSRGDVCADKGRCISVVTVKITNMSVLHTSAASCRETVGVICSQTGHHISMHTHTHTRTHIHTHTCTHLIHAHTHTHTHMHTHCFSFPQAEHRAPCPASQLQGYTSMLIGWGVRGIY